MSRKTKKIAAFLLTSILLFYVACRKIDAIVPEIKTLEPTSQEDKFFNMNRTGSPIEKSIVEFLKRANTKLNFVQPTIRQIGYPHWDKAILLRKSNFQGRSSTVTDSLIIIPFVRDTQSYVNAVLAIELSPNDTTTTWLCDWQYTNKAYTTNPLQDNSAEKFALFMMMMDAQVFGHKDFCITDSSLFKDLSQFSTHPQFNSGNNRYIHLELDSSASTANRVLAGPAPSYNWTLWYYYILDNYGLINFYSSIPNPEVGSGGSGGSPTVLPPPDCDPVAARRQTIEGCTPGWYYSGSINPTSPLANQLIIDSLQGYPCAQSVLAILPNLNNTTKALLQNTFGLSENFNIIFKADTTMPNYENGATKSVQKNLSTNTWDIKIRLNANVLRNSSKEFILNVMFHEAIHAYMNYQWFLYNTNQIDSVTFKAQFPQIWKYKNGSNSQHIEIAENYISKLKQTVLDFNNFADSGMVKAISWVGLQATPAWSNLGNDTIDIRQKAAIAKYGNRTQMALYNLKKCN
jgi:SprT-like family